MLRFPCDTSTYILGRVNKFWKEWNISSAYLKLWTTFFYFGDSTLVPVQYDTNQQLYIRCRDEKAGGFDRLAKGTDVLENSVWGQGSLALSFNCASVNWVSTRIQSYQPFETLPQSQWPLLPKTRQKWTSIECLLQWKFIRCMQHVRPRASWRRGWA